jgi:restriction system protein
MARRKKKEDGFDLLVEVPWGVSLVMGVVALFAVQGIQCQPSFRTLLYFIPGMIFFASFISLIKGLGKKLLHQKAKTIEEIKAMSWRDFETFVGEVFRRQGYSVEETGGGGADGGFDLILRKGNEKVLVQCKQWRTYQVGVKIVREMYGLMVAEQADRVIIVSVGAYTKDAADFARGKPIELIDGDKLVQLRAEQEERVSECANAEMRKCANARI